MQPSSAEPAAAGDSVAPPEAGSWKKLDAPWRAQATNAERTPSLEEAVSRGRALSAKLAAAPVQATHALEEALQQMLGAADVHVHREAGNHFFTQLDIQRAGSYWDEHPGAMEAVGALLKATGHNIRFQFTHRPTMTTPMGRLVKPSAGFQEVGGMYQVNAAFPRDERLP